MRFLVLAAALMAVACGMVVKEDFGDVLIGKDNMVTIDLKTKQLMIMKLLNHILQPTMYDDVRDTAREFDLNSYMDRFLKKDVVITFLDTYRLGMLPRGEIFVQTNNKQMIEAIKVFHVLYFAKDFDTFIRTCCWLREHINEGMFVYALTVAVLHRDDCRGILLPAPYEIYPYYFVNSDVIHKAFMMKMKKGVIDPVLLDYYRIHLTDKDTCVIDSRKDLRHTLTNEDRLAYFTEDIDLNTYFYYFHVDYPGWMVDDIFTVNKERRGEIVMYGYMQLLARYRLERLSHGMCDIKPIMWGKTLKTGYWPKIRMHNGEEMPMRSNEINLITEDNLDLKLVLDDFERLLREAVFTGRFIMRDGTIFKIEKPEDFEILCRLILTNLGWRDVYKTTTFVNLMKKMLNYGNYNMNKHTQIPTTIDNFETNLRDPVFWKLLKRITDICIVFKKLLPTYTFNELRFPGVKIEKITTDKLVTFIDDYDMDITNAVYLDKTEIKRKKSDMLLVARQRRLNNYPFKVTMDVVSEQAMETVVRVFLGPKYDCMGRLLEINDKRVNMVEIDSFLYKLDVGKNVIVRDSKDMHNIIGDRPWTRRMFDRTLTEMDEGDLVTRDSWWFRSRTGLTSRLLLPMGNRLGLELQLFVILTPVHKTMVLKDVDMDIMKTTKRCRFTACLDTMPLGFPFDRVIDPVYFKVDNMKWLDVVIYHKDIETMNTSKNVDFTDLVLKRDDLTWMDKDMLVRTRFADKMTMDMDRIVDRDTDVSRM